MSIFIVELESTNVPIRLEREKQEQGMVPLIVLMKIQTFYKQRF